MIRPCELTVPVPAPDAMVYFFGARQDLSAYHEEWADGSVSTARAFESEVWQKVGDDWKIVNLHYSEIPRDQ